MQLPKGISSLSTRKGKANDAFFAKLSHSCLQNGLDKDILWRVYFKEELVPNRFKSFGSLKNTSVYGEDSLKLFEGHRISSLVF